jgi:hypothetical protein
MAESQKLQAPHSDWGERAAIVPVSVDETMAIIRKHGAEPGWANTFNVPAGQGVGGRRQRLPIACRQC